MGMPVPSGLEPLSGRICAWYMPATPSGSPATAVASTGGSSLPRVVLLDQWAELLGVDLTLPARRPQAVVAVTVVHLPYLESSHGRFQQAVSMHLQDPGTAY